MVAHRIWSITDEMGETLEQMSGSPRVIKAHDSDFAIYDELGQEVQVGLHGRSGRLDGPGDLQARR